MYRYKDSVKKALEEARQSYPEETLVIEYLEGVLQYCEHSVFPSTDESIVVSRGRPKTAALCFDRVWGFQGMIPEEIRFGGLSGFELGLQVVGRVALDGARENITSVSSVNQGDWAQRIGKARTFKWCAEVMQDLVGKKLTEGFTTDFSEALDRRLSAALESELGRHVPIMYSSRADLNSEYKPGSHEVIIAALSNLEIVDEQELQWEQVTEFRKDAEARGRLTRMLHWLDGNMVGKNTAYIVDEIGIRLKDYRDALSKHGVKAALGIFTAVLDPKGLASAAAAGAGFLVAGRPDLGALTATGILVGKTLVEVGEAALDFKEVRRGHSPEIAFVHELGRLNKASRSKGSTSEERNS